MRYSMLLRTGEQLIGKIDISVVKSIRCLSSNGDKYMRVMKIKLKPDAPEIHLSILEVSLNFPGVRPHSSHPKGEPSGQVTL